LNLQILAGWLGYGQLGLSFQRTSVAKSENIIAAKRPLHKEPEP